MIRPNVRFAAVAAVVAGLLLSAGAGLAVADDEKGHNGGSNSSNSHGNSGKTENSNKPNSASAGGGSNGKSSGDNEGGGSDKTNKPSNSGSNSGSNAGGSSESHTASKTKPGGNGNGSDSDSEKSNSGGNGNGNSGTANSGESEDSKGEGKSNGNSSSSNAGGNGHGNSNGNASSDDDSSSEASQTPSAPATEQPAAPETNGSSSSPTAAASIPNKDNVLQPVPTSAVRPSGPAQPSHAPAAAAVAGRGSEPTDPGATANPGVTAPVPADGTADVAALTSARVWIAKVSDQFISSVAKAIREVTLKDLALAALPGIAGLFFVFMTGIGLGHRQAKFGFVMESTGMLKFAARGPLGVVRSSGSVAIKARKTRGSANLTLVENAA